MNHTSTKRKFKQIRFKFHIYQSVWFPPVKRTVKLRPDVNNGAAGSTNESACNPCPAGSYSNASGHANPIFAHQHRI